MWGRWTPATRTAAAAAAAGSAAPPPLPPPPLPSRSVQAMQRALRGAHSTTRPYIAHGPRAIVPRPHITPSGAAASPVMMAATTSARSSSGTAPHLWDYDGSRVVTASLAQVQALQRRAFGHRNMRTYVLVVADAHSPACAGIEASIEALATGLAHERGVAVLALDARAPDAAAFAARILNVGALPAVFVFPEGAPGCLAYRGADMTADGVLRAVNALRARALPGARPYALKYAAGGEPLPRAVTAAAANEPSLLEPTPLVVPSAALGGGYWTAGKAAFWAAVLGAAALFYLWDAVLEDRWEALQLARRVRQRRDGKRRFSAAETLDDILALLLLKGAADAAEQQAQRAAAAEASPLQLGWRQQRAEYTGAAGARDGGGGGGGEVIDVVASVDGGEDSGSNGSGGDTVSRPRQQQQQPQQPEAG